MSDIPSNLVDTHATWQYQQHACLHCGTALADGQNKFCCRGCQFVYETINSLGLEKFYKLDYLQGLKAEIDPKKSFDYLSDQQQLSEIVTTDNAGFQTISWYLPTIHCAACVWLLERLPHSIPGITKARVSLADGSLDLTINPALISVSAVARLLNSLGYPPVARKAEEVYSHDKQESRALLKRIGVAAVSAANTMMLGDLLFSRSSDAMPPQYRYQLTWLSMLIALPSITYAAFPFYRAAVGSLMLGHIHLDVPIAIGILLLSAADTYTVFTGGGAVYFDSVCCLIFLLLFARYLQRRALFRARASSMTTWDLLPSTARVIQNGNTIEKPLRELAVGDRLSVMPNEIIACDGIVDSGVSSVATSFFTGETIPQSVSVGSKVLAGSTNVEALIEIVASEVASSSRLSKIIESIKSQTSSGTAQATWIDSISGYFTICVILISIIAGICWWYIDSSKAFNVIVAFLVVSCPCALGLAAPVTHVIALAQAMKRGIYIKSVTALDNLARVQSFFFDKTGTLTTGVMSVADYYGEQIYLPVAASLADAAANHPIARAISTYAGQKRVTLSDCKFIPGRGVFGLWQDNPISLTSKQSCREQNIVFNKEQEQLIQLWEEQGAALSFVCYNQQLVAIFKLSDPIRVEAQEIMRLLRKQRVDVQIVSGDAKATTCYLGSQLGLDQNKIHSELSPEQKAQIIKTAQPIRAVLGDGINDAIAMKAADVAIALRGGIEVTLETADIFIARNELKGFVQLYDGSQRVRRVIYRNLIISLTYNLFCGAAALTAHITPLEAAILMPLSSLTVIVSALSATYFKKG